MKFGNLISKNSLQDLQFRQLETNLKRLGDKLNKTQTKLNGKLQQAILSQCTLLHPWQQRAVKRKTIDINKNNEINLKPRLQLLVILLCYPAKTGKIL